MILRNPDKGNTYTISPNVSIKTSLDGDTRFAKYNAPIIERQTLAFSGLTQADKNALVSFFLGNAGVQFIWKNHLGQTLTVVATNQTVTFTRSGQGCMYALSLNVEVL